MSRDFTPKELYLFEQHVLKNKGVSLLDTMKGTTFTHNGETTRLYSDESIANREKFPFIGRLFNRFDSLYSFLSHVDGGLDLLAQKEAELTAYIETGKGDKTSSVLQWFEGELDSHFHYSTINDERFLSSIHDEVGKLYRFDPKQDHCFWFPLSEEKCISVWYAPDKYDGDQLQMKLEQRGEDGSMGPHCEVLIDESYATANLSEKAILQTLREIYEDAGLDSIADSASIVLTDNIMSVFALKKPALDAQIQAAQAMTTPIKRDPNEHER